MAISSMTGYGRGEAASGGITVVVELSSVNRKQFDMRVNLPRTLIALESQASKVVHTYVSRGCVSGGVRVSVEGKARSGGIQVDMDAATAVARNGIAQMEISGYRTGKMRQSLATRNLILHL